MNLKHEILAVKKGYIIDSASVNIQNNTSLKFIYPDRLVLITENKVELYHFSLDRNAKPHRIVLKPRDSISISSPPNSIYCSTQHINDNLILFYQIDPTQNYRSDGEVIYWFTITNPMKLDDKIDKLFPIAEIDRIKKSGT